MSGKRRPDLNIGDKFDRLTIVRFERRGTNSVAVCRCDCGNEATPTTTVLRKGGERCCASCARRHAWSARRLPLGEAEFRIKMKNYINGAKKRGLNWALDAWRFRALYERACAYCGEFPARGVDRKNNKLGYTPENSVPCCARCNYAKRDQNETEFFAWLQRLFQHQGYSK